MPGCVHVVCNNMCMCMKECAHVCAVTIYTCVKTGPTVGSQARRCMASLHSRHFIFCCIRHFSRDVVLAEA